ncbi:MAG: glycine cleavage system protein GcvH [Chloroflexi bacterium]|uniref:Glycine cleavage system H protein n=1 Tax=Candidatus Chlorohelix allophototropha TaxID=3003348 RepID=A0A8T7M7I2_9CHLR|nr:glycine cleavage system protein GcvH [Chloroflexota bacterium]WJW68048.1 glycine cleavage system protein GcvH [Chloroflexota bacterium L227-S17]
MNFPENLKYSKEHEWVKVEGDVAIVGITEFAQDELGDIVYVDAPDVGKQLSQNQTFGVIESVKTVSDLYSPLSGEVIEVNAAVVNTPELVNKDPHGEGWIIKLKANNLAELNNLMDSVAYRALIGK